MPLTGVIEVSFDPLLRVGDLAVRWQTVGVTVALLIALAVAASIAGYLPVRRRAGAAAATATATSWSGAGRPRYPAAPTAINPADRLRLDDLVYIVLGIVPGAVVGGRLVHAIVYWDAYAADPARLLEAGVGSLSLLGAVLGGTISGAYIAEVLDAPLRRFADAGAVPLLLAVGLGKLAQFLGGSGQGLAFDGPWAVAFVGDGPWHSLAPEVPAHPAQVYEGLWMLAGIPLLLALAGPGRDLDRLIRRPIRWFTGRVRAAGLLFAGAICWFLLGRLLVGFTWRDELIVGQLNAEQLVALVVLIAVLLGLGASGVRAAVRRRRSIVSAER